MKLARTRIVILSIDVIDPIPVPRLHFAKPKEIS